MWYGHEHTALPRGIQTETRYSPSNTVNSIRVTSPAAHKCKMRRLGTTPLPKGRDCGRRRQGTGSGMQSKCHTGDDQISKGRVGGESFVHCLAESIIADGSWVDCGGDVRPIPNLTQQTHSIRTHQRNTQTTAHNSPNSSNTQSGDR